MRTPGKGCVPCAEEKKKKQAKSQQRHPARSGKQTQDQGSLRGSRCTLREIIFIKVLCCLCAMKICFLPHTRPSAEPPRKNWIRCSRSQSRVAGREISSTLQAVHPEREHLSGIAALEARWHTSMAAESGVMARRSRPWGYHF
ncbi:hypothetical protein MTO96_018619 [Rhipicephalus appendiculatus]